MLLTSKNLRAPHNAKEVEEEEGEEEEDWQGRGALDPKRKFWADKRAKVQRKYATIYKKNCHASHVNFR